VPLFQLFLLNLVLNCNCQEEARMSAKNRYVTDAQLLVIDRRYSSDDVALEASKAMARWRRDLSPLSSYGYG
jgi:hypothetical protein